MDTVKAPYNGESSNKNFRSGQNSNSSNGGLGQQGVREWERMCGNKNVFV